MKNNLSELWSKVLAAVETDVSKANYHTLFKQTALLSLDNNTATIAAPSAMVINLIQKRFLELLQTTLEKQAGQPINIVFVPKTILPVPENMQATGPLFGETETKPAFVGHLPRVRSDYTFDGLAVSSSNQLAYISATTVAKNVGRSYNPLFIYGPVGVGKTHLMHAIANEVYKQNPSGKIIYITSEEFTNEVVEAIRTNQTHVMKKRFRTTRLLIIDDVQFIAGKEKVQEELFHTFNILVDNGSQVVLSSDRPPHEIKKLETRLSSRFAGGLTVDIEPPDFELRTAILLIKAKKYAISLSIDLAKIIAEKTLDARSLEGVLLRIITQIKMNGEGVNEETIRKAIDKKEVLKPTRLHVEDIIQRVCSFYNIKPTLIKGPKRDAQVVRARQITMYFLKKELGLSFVEIGNVLGGRDHTTIMYGVKKMEDIVDDKDKGIEDIVGITRVLHE